LQTVTGYELPGTAAWFLRGMESDDALALWRAMGVSGSDAELAKLFATIDHYPLLIRALAGEVAGYRGAPGDFDAWRNAHPDFDPFSLSFVQAKSHVLAHALRNLDDEARELLHTIAAFRSPVDYDTVAALFVEGYRWSSQKLDGMLAQLEDRGLLGWDRRTNRYDLHPIVRGVVWRDLDDLARKAVYGRLEQHFSSVPTSSEGVNTLAEAEPMIELFNALVGLGRYEDASAIYFVRIHGGDFSFFDEGMEHVNIAMLEGLFPDGLDQPPRAKANNIGGVYSQLGHAYGGSGRLLEARSCHLRALNARCASDGILHDNISRGTLPAGLLREALDAAASAVDAPHDSLHDFHIGQLAVCEATIGQVEKAMKRLSATKRGSYYNPADYEVHVAYRRGAYDAAAAVARQLMMEDPRYSSSGVALILADAGIHLGDTAEASAILTNMLREARSKGWGEFELESLRVLADLHRRTGDFAQARAFLDDLAEPAARGPYRLIQADAFNVLAELERDCGNRDAAIASARAAYERAWCDGPPYAYHWGLERAKRLLQELGVTSS
jgi:tetratricopeptide (TPR) repeat protein